MTFLHVEPRAPGHFGIRANAVVNPERQQPSAGSRLTNHGDARLDEMSCCLPAPDDGSLGAGPTVAFDVQHVPVNPMQQQPVVLPLNCHRCGGAVGVACELDEDPNGRQTVRFACPYCELPREFRAPGRVLRIATLQQNQGPAIRH
ncbi:MAG: hypothetical protein ABI051_12960 [Vicinamibacterales bacterium]